MNACMRVALAMTPRVRRVPPEAWCRRVRAVLGEHGDLSAAGTHARVDEGKRFVGGEGVDGDGDGDGTGEGFEHGQAELAGEILGAAQDDGERVEGIDAEIGQQSDLREDLGAQKVGLVDEQDGMDVGGVVEVQDVLLDVAEHGGAAVVGLQAEQDRQVGVELDGTDGRMAQVEGAVEAGVQTMLQEAQQAALAGAGLAGDGADAAGVDEQPCGGEVAFDGGQEEELVDRDLLGEGQPGEIEEAQQFAVVVHRDCSGKRSVEGLIATREAASEAAAGGSGSSGGSELRATGALAASLSSSPEGSRRRSARRTRALA